ncbi:MAG: glycoside hydrolase family 43 protein [Opitutales bacterium]|nr:glycoside hydrolase family 43 protein [Opitutales bacterium]
MPETSGYLFATFKSESGPQGEQVYFALSKDGLEWKAVNNAEPVLVNTLGEQGVRDPFLIRSHDQEKFYLIGTDLSIYHNPNWGRAVRQGSRAIIIWESTDLINWSEPRRVEVAPESAGCTWAPEAIYDPEKESYLVFWGSTTAEDDFAKHRIWAAYTEDFKEFGEPFIYIEENHAVIDTTIVQDNDRYYRFTKDETNKRIIMESASSIGGSWSLKEDFSLAGLHGYEGPQCFPLVDDEGNTQWMLILDNYARQRGYQAFITSDLSGAQFEPMDELSVPFHFRHGSVIPLTDEEYERTQKHW